MHDNWGHSGVGHLDGGMSLSTLCSGCTMSGDANHQLSRLWDKSISYGHLTIGDAQESVI